MKLHRRSVLRGAGVALSLPWLDAMTARHARGATTRPPLRAAVLYVPNGVIMDKFFPTQVGKDFDLPATLAPLEPFRDDLMVLSGLAQQNAEPGPDGAGDHARAMACFLTGVRPNKSDGSSIRAGVSFDQVAATGMGAKTRLPSLELGCERGSRAGACDSGYACVYSYNMSWRTPSLPLDFETDPGMAFDRIFGVSPQVARSRRSLLDLVRDDTRKLSRALGGRDREKLDEFLTATREVERRLARFGRRQLAPPAGAQRPDHPPATFEEHIRMMCDIITLAFQIDATRVVTFALASEGSEKTFPAVGVHEGHHHLSHHQGDARKIELLTRIDHFYTQQLAYMLGKLKTTREGERPLLDSTMLLYGSGISDGMDHRHDDLPIILAGRANGTLGPGRHLRYAAGTPLNNLFLSMLDRLGTPLARLGDSTGRLDDLGAEPAPVAAQDHPG